MDDNELLDSFESVIGELSGIDAASDFCESLSEKHDSMREWYDEHGELTDGQRNAIENMIAGAQRWLDWD